MGFLSSESQLNFHIPCSRLVDEGSLPPAFTRLSQHSAFSPYSSISDSAFSCFCGGGFPLYFLAVVLISENTYYLRNLRQPISQEISPNPFEKPLMQLQAPELVFQHASAVVCPPQSPSRLPPTPLSCGLGYSSAELSAVPKSLSEPHFPAVLWGMQNSWENPLESSVLGPPTGSSFLSLLPCFSIRRTGPSLFHVCYLGLVFSFFFFSSAWCVWHQGITCYLPVSPSPGVGYLISPHLVGIAGSVEQGGFVKFPDTFRGRNLPLFCAPL